MFSTLFITVIIIIIYKCQKTVGNDVFKVDNLKIIYLKREKERKRKKR